MQLKERYEKVLAYFQENKPEVTTELKYSDPYQLIVAVILSAQCTDKRVNTITPELFRRFPDANSMAQTDVEQIYELIKSCSYPNNKAKHLSGMSKMLVNTFNNKVPEDIKELQKLPGIGRKSANVIASVIHKKPAMAVDTHVFRVAARLGLTQNAKTPLAAEKQLVENIPEELIPKAHHWLILHGRYICIARNPKCSKCELTAYCEYYAYKNFEEPGIRYF